MKHLDIVRDNPSLTFDQDVNYNFTYWMHRPEHAVAAAEAVAANDIIAIETTSASNVAAAKQFARGLNDVLRGTASRSTSERISNLASRGSQASIVALHLAGSRKRISLIDAWVHSDDPTHITQIPPNELAGDMLAEPRLLLTQSGLIAEHFRQRESLAINQLAEIGAASSRVPGKQTLDVGVLYGANHSLVSVAMQSLGANVTRQFTIKPSSFGADEMLYRAIRATDKSPADLESMSQAVHIARKALFGYMAMHPNAKHWILNNLKARAQVKVDSLIALTILESQRDSTDAKAVIEAGLSQPFTAPTGWRKGRQHQKITSEFSHLVERHIKKALALSTT